MKNSVSMKKLSINNFTTKLLKPYLFAHPNPINAIISWIISWTDTIQDRKMVIACQLIVQLIIALSNWIWMSKKIGL